jgi:hypothetical protein
VSRFLLLLDSGPCMGGFEVKRAPRTLRAVRTPAGKLDVLDLLEDEPSEGEEIFVYTRVDDQVGHICGRGRCLQTVAYRYVGPLDKETGELGDVDDAARRWWDEQRMVAMRAWAMGETYRTPAAPPAQGSLL